MLRTIVISSLCCIATFGQSYAQEVVIARDTSAQHPKKVEAIKKAEPVKKAEVVAHEASTTPQLAKENFPKAQPVKQSFPKAEPVKEQVGKQQSPIVQIMKAQTVIVAVQPAKGAGAGAEPAVAQSGKAKPPEKDAASNQPQVVQARTSEAGPIVDVKPAMSRTNKLLWPKNDLAKTQTVKPPAPAKESIPGPLVVTSEPEKAPATPSSTAAVQSVKTAPAKTAPAQPVVETVKVELRPKEPLPAPPNVAQTKKPQPIVSATLKKETRTEQTNTAQTLSQPPNKLQSVASRPAGKPTAEPEAAAQPIIFRGDTAFTRLADGFDFPVGKPNAEGYYKARGFRSRGHLGEDWDGIRGGDSDLGDPIYSIGDGVVVFARDCHMGWGNVIIVRHSFREGGMIKNIDALYGHLNNMQVHRGQAVSRGQKIATMGTAHGLYDAHLHLEIRKNLEIGMSRAAFARDFSNYYDPTQFINLHRHLQAGSGSYRIAMNTFTRDARINFDKARNFSHARSAGGSRESTAALKKAVAAQGSN